MTRSSQRSPLDAQTIASIDSAVERWQAAIQNSGDAMIEQFLPPVGSPQRHDVLTKLAGIELDVRIRRGEPFRIETLLKAHDALTSEDILPLMVTELRARQSVGERVKRRDYRERFPDQYEALKALTSQSPKSNQTSSVHIKSRSNELPIGKRFGDFEIVKRLGAGSYADVYLANQISLGREVAIKISAEKKNEAKALAKLDHPNIVPVYSEHNVAKRHLLVMRYVQGKSLGQWLQLKSEVDVADWSGDKFLAWLREDATHGNSDGDRDIANTQKMTVISCQIVMDVARALAHAHDRGVLHLDIKPANIMVDTNGRGMLMDFNVAAMPDESGLRSTRPSGGTLAYMPPEQLSHFVGETGCLKNQVGKTTDLYALGVVFYELLTGSSPWPVPEGDSGPNVATQLLAARMRPPLRIHEVLHSDLAPIVQRMLAPSPTDRYPDAQHVVNDLKSCVASQTSKSTGTQSLVGGFFRQNRAKLSVMVAAIAIGAILLGPRVLRSPSDDDRASRPAGMAKDTKAPDKERISPPLQTAVATGNPDTPKPDSTSSEKSPDVKQNEKFERPSVVEIVTRGRHVQLDSHIRRAMIRGRRDREFTINPIMLYGTEIPLDWEEKYSRLRLDETHSRMLDESVTEILLFQLFARTKNAEDETAAKDYFFSRLPADHEQLPLIETLRRRSTKQPITEIPTASLLVIVESEFERYLLGVVAAIREEHDTAITLFQKCKGDNPERHTTLFYFGISAERAGRVPEAIRAYTACIQQHPDFFPPYFCLGALRKNRGEFDMVKRLFRQVLDEYPNQVEHYVSLASILSQLDKYDEAVAVLDRAIDRGFRSATVLTRRASLKRKLGNTQSAKKDLQDALSIDPKFRPAQRELRYIANGRK